MSVLQQRLNGQFAHCRELLILKRITKRRVQETTFDARRRLHFNDVINRRIFSQQKNVWKSRKPSFTRVTILGTIIREFVVSPNRVI